MPEEYVITLVVECDSSAALKIGVLTEDRGEHAPQPVTQPCAKIVQYELWAMGARSAMALDVFAEAQIGQLKVRCGAIRQVHQQQAVDSLAILIEDNHVSEVPVCCILADLLEGEPLSFVICSTRQHFQHL